MNPLHPRTVSIYIGTALLCLVALLFVSPLDPHANRDTVDIDISIVALPLAFWLALGTGAVLAALCVWMCTRREEAS